MVMIVVSKKLAGDWPKNVLKGMKLLPVVVTLLVVIAAKTRIGYGFKMLASMRASCLGGLLHGT